MKTLQGLPLILLAGAAAAAPASATPPSASAPAVPTIAVTVSNPTAAARASETISVTVADLTKLAPGFDAKKSVVTDAAGQELLSQLVDIDADGTPEEIVFQTDLGAKQSLTFKVKPGARSPAGRDDYKVYGRFVRERYDDFAWENDRVAHRMYGAALETHPKEPLTSSGIDTWVKRVPKLVINDWYLTGNYHQDHGEGADYYGVGKSRGLGGLGIWAGGKLYVSQNFTQSRVLAAGPIRLVFELDYAPWDAGKKKIGETKRVTLDAGSQWNRFESRFTGQRGGIAAGVGIAKHPGSAVKVDARAGTMRVWEPLDGGKGGNLGTAIVLPAGSKLEAHHGDLEYLIVTRVPKSGRLVYYAGSAWDRAGRIKDQAAWAVEVQALARRLADPVKVKLAVTK
jgi:unsaturated rhamnogalacturonyl hydrolase